VVDASVIVRDYLLGCPGVTALLGTNANGSIYCAYDLPEHFDPKLGPAIQIFRAGGHSHDEITVLVDARLQIRAWADVERYSAAAALYGAINDVLHGVCGVATADGTIVRALEVDGPIEMTDPQTGWVSMYAFYTVMARPGVGSFVGPGGISVSSIVGIWSEGAGAPSVLQANGDYYLNLSTGDIYLQTSGAWGSPIGNIKGGGSVPSLTYHKVSAASTNAANIKASAGTVTGWKIYNNTGYPIFVKLYNKSTTPVPGTDTPQQTIGVDAGTGDVITGAGYTYATGIGIAMTKNIDDMDNTALLAKDCVVDVFYQ
jgi:hypothetical protein